MVIETISEDLDAKKEIFAKLNPFVGPGVIIASNTSTLSLTELAAESFNPE